MVVVAFMGVMPVLLGVMPVLLGVCLLLAVMRGELLFVTVSMVVMPVLLVCCWLFSCCVMVFDVGVAASMVVAPVMSVDCFVRVCISTNCLVALQDFWSELQTISSYNVGETVALKNSKWLVHEKESVESATNLYVRKSYEHTYTQITKIPVEDMQPQHQTPSRNKKTTNSKPTERA